MLKVHHFKCFDKVHPYILSHYQKVCRNCCVIFAHCADTRDVRNVLCIADCNLKNSWKRSVFHFIPVKVFPIISKLNAYLSICKCWQEIEVRSYQVIIVIRMWYHGITVKFFELYYAESISCNSQTGLKPEATFLIVIRVNTISR